MKKIIVTTTLAMIMAIGVGTGNAQMMGGKHMMGGGQQKNVSQQPPCMMMGGGGMGMMGNMMGGGMGMMGSDMDMQQYNKAMDDTRETRRKLHDMKFKYGEAMRNPKTTMGDLQQMREKMNSMQQEIMQKMQQQNN